MADYLNSKNTNDAVNAMREMKAPKHFLSEMLNKIVVYSLDRSDEDKENASSLIHALCTEGLVTGENLMQVSVLMCVKFLICLKYCLLFEIKMLPVLNHTLPLK